MKTLSAERKDFSGSSNSRQFQMNATSDSSIINQVYDIHASKDLAKKRGLSEENEFSFFAMINQLLDLHNIESEKLRLVYSKNNLEEYLNNLITSLNTSASIGQCIVHNGDRKKSVWFDKNKMDEILYYLFSEILILPGKERYYNILLKYDKPTQKYSDGFVKIIIYSHLHGNETGVNAAHNASNNKTYNVISAASSGNRIGLTWAKKLLNMHLGEIHFQQKESYTDVCIITLPYGDSHISEETQLPDKPVRTQSASRFAHQAQGISGTKPTKALIVTKDPEVYRQINNTLLTDCQPFFVRSNDAAYDMALKIIPDVIISHMEAHGNSELILCEKIKRNKLTSFIPIIMLSDVNTEANMIYGLETGADAYFSLPLSQCEIRSKIVMLVEKSRKSRSTGNQVMKMHYPLESLSSENVFIEKLNKVCEKNYENPEFSMSSLSKELAMSNSSLYRKIKCLLGISASKYIRSFRLKRAAQMLLQNNEQISAVTYSVGFDDTKYFRKCFKEEFGVTPRDYMRYYTVTRL